MLSFKDAYTSHFLIGTGIDSALVSNKDTIQLNVVRGHFNALVPVSCMSAADLQPYYGVFCFENADSVVDFGIKNNFQVVGHTLISSSQLPAWFFVDDMGNEVERDVLIERMKLHVQTIVSHFKGRVCLWNVVDEVLLENGNFCNNKLFRIIGEDYVKLAFEFAKEVDPGAKYYLYDYSLLLSQKRAGVINLVKKLQMQGVSIDGITTHYQIGSNTPVLSELENSITSFGQLGLKVIITDVEKDKLNSGILKKSVKHTDGTEQASSLVAYKEKEVEQLYIDAFQLFIRQSDVVSAVIISGITDRHLEDSNNKDLSLLFDSDGNPSKRLSKIIQLVD